MKLRINITISRGFTLVELMVVIAIIGVLATLIMVTLDNTKTTARNTRRLSDIKQLQLALKLYYNDNGFYPTSITPGASLARNGVNYMLRVPSNPKPWNDGTCPPNDYQYTQLEGGKRYSLNFCVSAPTDDLLGGAHVATSNGILNCPTGYIGIPGNATLETTDFCVMQYEAKCACTSTPTTGLTTPATGNTTYDNSLSGSNTACTGSAVPNYACIASNNRQIVSTISGIPIANITQANAKTYCQSAGGHLITNVEWMTIARNIEQVASNWNGGVIGTSWINQGNYSTSNALDGTVAGSGQSKRTHTLSTGDVIWDIAGNVGEWTDDTCTTAAYPSGGYTQWSQGSLSGIRPTNGPSIGTWDDTNGMGRYYGCPANGRPFYRGGSLGGASFAGIYQMNMNSAVGSTAATLGFRCVK